MAQSCNFAELLRRNWQDIVLLVSEIAGPQNTDKGFAVLLKRPTGWTICRCRPNVCSYISGIAHSSSSKLDSEGAVRDGRRRRRILPGGLVRERDICVAVDFDL